MDRDRYGRRSNRELGSAGRELGRGSMASDRRTLDDSVVSGYRSAPYDNWQERLNEGDTFIHWARMRPRLNIGPPPNLDYNSTLPEMNYVDDEFERKSEESREDSRSFRMRLVIGLVLGLVIIAAAITAYVLVTQLKTTDEAPAKILAKADLTAEVTNENFVSAMSDNTSREFQDFQDSFCTEVDRAYTASSLGSDYVGCVVRQLQPGSVIVSFTTVFYAFDPVNFNTMGPITVHTVTVSSQLVANVGSFRILISSIATSGGVAIAPGESPVPVVPTTTEAPPDVVVGEPCTVDSNCTIPFSGCLRNQDDTSTCNCRPGYTPNYNRGACVEAIGASCTQDTDCTDLVQNTKCDVTKSCDCQEGYRRTGLSCMKVLGASCSDELHCGMDFVGCLENTDGNKECACLAGYRIDTTNLLCERILDAACSSDGECAVDNTLCVQQSDSSHTCDCAVGYMRTADNLNCIQVLEASCTRDADCDLQFASCPGNQQCACRPGSKKTDDGILCELVLGGLCGTGNPCEMDNAECREPSGQPNFCECMNGYMRTDANLTCAQVLNAGCVEDADCPLDLAVCNGDSGECSCKQGTRRSADGPVCIHILGGPCSTDDNCTLAHSGCDDSDDGSTRSCDCDSGYSQAGDRLSCEKVLGSSCDVTNDCLLEHTACHQSDPEGTTKQCECATGYKRNADDLTCVQVLGIDCLTDGHCEPLQYAVCVPASEGTNGTCGCRTGTRVTQSQLTCEKVLGASCTSVAECSVPYTDCVEQSAGSGTCQCQPGYYRTGDGFGCALDFTCQPSLTATLGEPADMSCNVVGLPLIAALRITFPGGTVFEMEDPSSLADGIAITDRMSVKADLAPGAVLLLSLTIAEVQCPDEGLYSLTVNDLVTNEVTLFITNDPPVPVSTAPDTFLRFHEETFSCYGDVGRDKEGKPTASLLLETKKPDQDEFVDFTENVVVLDSNDTCVNSQSLELVFVVTEDWDGAQLRCVTVEIEGGRRHQSDTVTIQALLPSIYFRNPRQTEYEERSLILTCEGNDLLGLTQMVITRKMTPDSDFMTVATLTPDQAVSEMQDVWVDEASSKMETSSGTFVLNFSNLKCDQRGEYFCVAVVPGDSRSASTIIEVQSKPEKPTLTVAHTITEGIETTELFTCVGDVGAPIGSMAVQSTQATGEFAALDVDHLEHFNYTVEETACGNVVRLSFRYTFTTAWSDSQLRCVATNENVPAPIPTTVISDPQTIHVLPGDACDGLTDTVENPFNCHSALTCDPGATVTPCDCEGCCFHTLTQECVPCPEIGGCRTGDHFFRQSGYTSDVGETISLQCDVRNTDDLTQLHLERVTSTVNEVIAVVNITDTSVLSTRQGLTATGAISTSGGTIGLHMDPMACSGAGTYLCIRNNDIDTAVQVDLTVHDRNGIQPTLAVMPVEIQAGSIVLMDCTGHIGSPQREATMLLQRKGISDTDYSTVDADAVPTDFEINCNIQRTFRVTVTVDQSWADNSVRCVVIDSLGNQHTSEEKVITFITNPKFTCQTAVSAPLLNDTTLTCTVEETLTLTDFTITFPNGALFNKPDGELRNVYQVNPRISLTFQTAGDGSTVIRLNVPEVQCTDEGLYTVRVNDQYTAYWQLAATSAVLTPEQTLPAEFIIFRNTEIVCTGKAGRDADGEAMSSIAIEIFKVGGDGLVQYTDPYETEESISSCIITQTAKIQFEVDETWENAEVTCVTTLKRDNSRLTSNTEIIQTRLPALTCDDVKTANLDSDVTLGCSLEQIAAIRAIKLENEEGALLTLLSTQQGVEGSLTVDDHSVLTIEMGAEINIAFTINGVLCSDESQYNLTINGVIYGLFELRVISRPVRPVLTYSGMLIHTDVEFRCQGIVGRSDAGGPAATLVIDVKKPDNTGELIDAEKTVKDGCVFSQEVSYVVPLDETWTGVEIVCVSTNADTQARLESETVVIQPLVPELNCGAEIVQQASEPAEVACSLTDKMPILKMAIVFADGSSYEKSSETGLSGAFTVTDRVMLTIATADTASVNLTWSELLCTDEGVVTVTINDIVAESVQVYVTDMPSLPDLVVPPEFVHFLMAEIACSGEVGRDTQGEATSVVTVEYRKGGDASVTVYSGDQPEVTSADCVNVQNVSMEFQVDETWNGATIRCANTGTDGAGSRLESASHTVVVKLPDFTCEAMVSSFLNTDAVLSCVMQSIPDMNDLNLRFPDGTEFQSPQFMSFSQPIQLKDRMTMDISFLSTIDFTLSISEVICEDEGQYDILVNNFVAGSTILRVVETAATPSISGPAQYFLFHRVEVMCTGNVGRNENGGRLSGLVFEIKMSGQTDFTMYDDDISLTETTEGCKNIHFISLVIEVTSDWNGAEIRCVSVYEEGNDRLVSSAILVTTQPPGVTCNATSLEVSLAQSVAIACSIDITAPITNVKLHHPEEGTLVTDSESGLTRWSPTDHISMTFTVDEETGLTLHTVTYSAMACTDEGNNRITINNGIDYSWDLIVVYDPLDPTLELTGTFAVRQNVAIVCSGNVGRGPDGNPINSVSLYGRKDGDSVFVRYPEEPVESTENCVNTQSLVKYIMIDATWNNTEIMCISTHIGSTLQSPVQTIFVEKPAIDCQGGLVGNLGQDVTITCATQGLPNPEVSVNHADTPLFSDKALGSHVDGRLTLTVGDASVVLALSSLECNDSGLYHVSVFDTYESSALLDVKSDPDVPTLTVQPTDIPLNAAVQIACEGQLGFPRESTTMVIEWQLSDEEEFSLLSEDQNDVNEEQCTTAQRVSAVVTMDGSWQDAKLRCTTSDSGGDLALRSEEFSVQLGEPDVSFDQVIFPVKVGDNVTLTCSVTKATDLQQLEIAHHLMTGVPDFLAQVNSSGVNVDANRAGVTANSDSFTSTSARLSVTLHSLQCSDEGDVICMRDRNTTTKSDIRILAEPGTPTLTLPDSIWLFQRIDVLCEALAGRDSSGNPTADVDLMLKPPGSGFSLYSGVKDSTVIDVNCTNTERVLVDMTVTEATNGSEVKCVTLGPDASILHESPVQVILAALPTLQCEVAMVTEVGADFEVQCTLTAVDVISTLQLQQPAGEVFEESLGTDLQDRQLSINGRMAITVQKGMTVQFTFTVSPVECSDEGTYSLSVNGLLEESIELAIQSPVKDPALAIPADLVFYTEVEITCQGEVGRTPAEETTADLSFEVKKQGTGQEFTTLTEGTTSSTSSENCVNSATLSMVVYLDETWGDAEIQCVATGRAFGRRYIAGPEVLSISQPNVRFTSKRQVGYYQTSHSMTCEVEDVHGLQQIFVMRGITVVASIEETTSYVDGVNINEAATVLNSDSGVLEIEFALLECKDEGEYVCTAVSSTMPTGSATLEVYRNPDPPTLSSPLFFRAGQEVTLTCAGQLGVPPGAIVVQSTVDTETFSDLVTTGVPTIEESECSNVASMKFNYTLTQEWSGKQLRCAVKSDGVSDTSEIFASDPLTINFTPDDICTYDQDGIVKLPYDCHSYGLCLDGVIDAALTCGQTSCFSEVQQGCIPCSAIGGCDTDEPNADFQCTDVTATMTSTAEFSCTLASGTITTVSVVKENTEQLFTDATATAQTNGRFTISGVGESTIVVRVSAVQCVDQQKYIVTANDQHTGAAMVTVENAAVTAPEISFLSSEQVPVGGVLVVTCSSDLGIPVQSAAMFVERKFMTETEFMTLDTGGNNPIDDVIDCAVRRSVTASQPVDKSWNGTALRCRTVDYNGGDIISTEKLVSVVPQSGEISFSETQYSAVAGAVVSIACTVQDVTEMDNMTIYSQPPSGGEPVPLATLTQAGTGDDVPPGTTITHTPFSSTGATLTIHFDSIQCSDDGTLFGCLWNQDFDKLTTATLQVTGDCD